MKAKQTQKGRAAQHRTTITATDSSRRHFPSVRDAMRRLSGPGKRA